MYSRMCLLCIIVTLSLGYVASKSGVEENDKQFSVPLEVIHPRDWNCKLMSNQSKCEVDLETVDDAPAQRIRHGLVYLMQVVIAKQIFNVQLDTGSDLLWIFGDKCLDGKNKNCAGHPKYVVDKKQKYKSFRIDYADEYVEGDLVHDEVHITDLITVHDMQFGAADDLSEAQDGNDGVIGLNMNIEYNQPSAIYFMIEQKLITRPVYSLYLEAGPNKKVGGEITFGGRMDKVIVPKSAVGVDMLPGGQTIIKMTSISINKDEFCIKGMGPCMVEVDSGAPAVYSPKAFVDVINAIIHPDDENMVACESRSIAPTIEILFGKQRITLEPEYYIILIEKECYSTIVLNPLGEGSADFIFGVSFFYKYYIEFDFTPKKEAIIFYNKV
ncbi:Aspartic proteinase 1 [Oopsacas minuta]|uniref:Aspartic proteinase 1 n=1 Tax=Oopsacas minuta TaxID=111878 RepID=A0AAV7JC71_9METZ|nr:Aspartic proteinase 1 [Oopsacas minuta]